jgi:hypothetical protein
MELTDRQAREIQRAARRAERAAATMAKAFDDLRAVFPIYTSADRGTIMAAARATDEANRNARTLRDLADRAAPEMD